MVSTTGLVGELPTASSLQLPALERHASSREIGFRRLLYSTEQQLACVPELLQADEAESLPSLAKLQHSMHTIEDQLADLERMQGSLSLSPEKVTLYRQHVKQMSGRLPALQLPRYCQQPAPKAAVPSSLSTTSLSAAAKAVLGTTLSQGVPVGADSAPGGGAAGSSWTGKFSGQSQADHHARHQALQDDLTEELANQAAALKNYSYKLQEAVQTRGTLVDGTERVLEKNTDTAKKISARASEQYKRGTSSFCLTCMVFLVVGMVFSMMVVYIKMTSLVGYRANRSSTSWLGGLFKSRDPFDDEL